MFGPSPGLPPMGKRNVTAARQVLAVAQIPVVGEDVLGAHGRSVYFYLDDGRIEIRSLAGGNLVL
jgi:chemotaxis protein CheD